MKMVDIIRKKRDAQELTKEELYFVAMGAADGSLPDYQLSALLMAIYLRGMSERETAELTLAMAQSGDQMDLSGVGGPTADKHSTGGVGDKTTLIVAPLAAVLGCRVAKMSGRGLGFTGGTVDKLESIPGFCTVLDPEEFLNQVQRIGLSVIGQSGNMAPADKRLYALRDVTATVDNISLIAASIMSKKLAAGAQNIVLDVKVGSGAFMKTKQDAVLLAKEMVRIGRRAGRRVRALLTNMDVPLGRAVGNALEVAEAVEILRGGGDDRLTELCVTLAAHMAALCSGNSSETCEKEAKQALSDGRAFQKFCEMVGAQGGDTAVLHNPDGLTKARERKSLPSPQSGYLCRVDSELTGLASANLGAGRFRKEDSVDHSAGVILLKAPGQWVEKGQPVFELHTGNKALFAPAQELLLQAVHFSDTPPEQEPLILDVIG